MKKIFVKPQVSALTVNTESMIMASGDPQVHTGESASQGGTALAKMGAAGNIARGTAWSAGKLEF